MKEITKYVADDGKEFYYASDCLEYEDNLQMLNAVNTITNICDRRESCSGCALYNACSDHRWFYCTPDMWYTSDLNQEDNPDESLAKAIQESNEKVKNMPKYNFSGVEHSG